MGEAAAGRYRAFISYSHVDQAFGRRLHRRLERYVLPRRLVGRETPRGPVPRRVAPVFRDREEFSAAGDLTAEVRAALAASASLIVVCSPAAAASPWVGREVELFRELHPDRPVLAVVAAGEPAECFPKALTVAGGAAVEPLAADFRPHADGPRLGLLKLVAGVVGVGLDELVQRDAQRRLVAVTAVTSGAVAVALAMTALTTFAVLAQREAERQRGQAEALVEFMLTDLRDRLKGVGRLDVLGAVNERTLKYYADQEIEELPPASQARYARILMAMGEDDIQRGDRAGSLAKASAAKRITGRLRAAQPDDVDRIWADAQSEYLLGYREFLWGARPNAEAHWASRRDLAARLARREPANPMYRRELGYAEGDLCALALRTRRRTPGAAREDHQPLAARRHCANALSEMEEAVRLDGENRGLVVDLITRRAWMANAYVANSEMNAALGERNEQMRLLDAQLAADPRNTELLRAWITGQQGLASMEVRRGQLTQARARVIKASAMLDELIAFEPANREWAHLRQGLDRALAYFERTHGASEGVRR